MSKKRTNHIKVFVYMDYICIVNPSNNNYHMHKVGSDIKSLVESVDKGTAVVGIPKCLRGHKPNQVTVMG